MVGTQKPFALRAVSLAAGWLVNAAVCAAGGDCNENGVPDTMDIVDGTSQDCDLNAIPDECDIAECPPMSPACGDCNVNGVPDGCDISDGTSLDTIPPLGVPDECSFWIGMLGFWSNPMLWNPPVVPDNNAVTNFAVNIRGANQAVMLDIEAEIGALRIGEDASLLLTMGDLRVFGSSRIHNDGTLVIENGRTLTTSSLAGTGSSLLLRGNGVFRLAGTTAGLASLPGPGKRVITNHAVIAGEGVVSAELVNENAVSADQPGATLRITGDLPKTNNGLMQAANGGTLAISDTAILGTGDYAVAGGSMIVESTMPGLTTAVGGNALSIIDGTVIVSPDSILSLTGPMTIGAHGLFTGPMNTAASPTGRVTAVPGGAVMVDSVAVSCDGGMQLNDGMFVETIGDFVMIGAATQPIGGCAPPALIADGGASIQAGGTGNAVHVAGHLELVNAVEVFFASTMQLGGDFDNRSVAPNVFDWIDGELLLPGTTPQRFEVGGIDHGPILPGFLDNFAMGTVSVADGGDVTFEDVNDNDGTGQGDCTEALYVYNLSIGAAATIDIVNTRIYFAHSTGMGSISATGCGQAILLPTGDHDGDRDVDDSDYHQYDECVTVSTETQLASGCATFDCNMDDLLDLHDFACLQIAWGGVVLRGSSTSASSGSAAAKNTPTARNIRND